MNKSKKVNGGAKGQALVGKKVQPSMVSQSQKQLPIDFAPVAMSQRQGTQRPVVTSQSNSGDLRVRVRHREYVADIAGSIAYAVTTYALNPGLSASFPWLSQLANLFESYQFNRLVFQYRTQAATSATGKALLSVDWDAADSAPQNKAQQLQERTKMDDAAWKNFDLPCDLADLRKFGVQRFTRSGTLASNLDIKTYDIGQLFVGTQGEANANAIGELWVEYDIELITPQNSQAAVSGSSAKVTASGSVSKTNLFGNAPVVSSSIGLTASGNTLVFSQTGTYLVDILRAGTTLVALPVPGVASGGGLSSTINAAATSALDQMRFTVVNVPQVITFDASGDATDTTCVVRICPAALAAA